MPRHSSRNPRRLQLRLSDGPAVPQRSRPGRRRIQSICRDRRVRLRRRRMDHPARPREALTSPGPEPIEQTFGRFCLLSCISSISWFIFFRCLARNKPDFHRHDPPGNLILRDDRRFLKLTLKIRTRLRVSQWCSKCEALFTE
jgi:hypothetical protein